MATVTLAESAKLTQDMLLRGVIESVVAVNPIYDVMPWMEIEGNALGYNRENALGDVQFLGVGGTITAKAAATFTYVTSSLTTLIGDAEVNGLIQEVRSNKQDQTAIQVASKAKSLGRQYQNTMINGDGTANTFTGLLSLVPAAQKVATGTNGKALDFDVLDNLIDLVKDKDGQVDFIMMPFRTRRAYLAMLRALGGASINEVVQLPGASNRSVPGYRGIPIFVNDWIPTNQTKGSSTNTTTIFAGCFDDGSGKHGISGLTAIGAAGLRVQEIGPKEAADDEITRVKMYCGFALFSELGIALADGITN